MASSGREQQTINQNSSNKHYGGTHYGEYAVANAPAGYQQIPSNSNASIHVTINTAGEHGAATQVPEGVKHVETYLHFTDRSIRMAFIRKVYLILTLQLLITAGFIALFIFVQPIKTFCLENWWMNLVAAGVVLFCIILTVCIFATRYLFPYNLLLLLFYTCCMSFSVGTISAYFSVYEVIIAFGCTMVITIGVTLFTFQTKWDFTFKAIFVLLLILFAISFGGMCGLYYGFGWSCRFVISNGVWYQVCYSHWYMVFCAFAVVLFSLFLIADTRMMIGGKHKYALSPEEYIFASLNLYMDVIMIFIYLLILGGRR